MTTNGATTTMQTTRPGVDWQDGAGEPPIGTFSARIDAEVKSNAGKEALLVTLTLEEPLGDTPQPEASANLEMRCNFWLQDLLPTKADGSVNKRVGQKRRQVKAFVAGTGKDMPDISDFSNLSELQAFAASIQDSTVNVRAYKGSDGKVYPSFDVRI